MAQGDTRPNAYAALMCRPQTTEHPGNNRSPGQPTSGDPSHAGHRPIAAPSPGAECPWPMQSATTPRMSNRHCYRQMQAPFEIRAVANGAEYALQLDLMALCGGTGMSITRGNPVCSSRGYLAGDRTAHIANSHLQIYTRLNTSACAVTLCSLVPTPSPSGEQRAMSTCMRTRRCACGMRVCRGSAWPQRGPGRW